MNYQRSKFDDPRDLIVSETVRLARDDVVEYRAVLKLHPSAMSVPSGFVHDPSQKSQSQMSRSIERWWMFLIIFWPRKNKIVPSTRCRPQLTWEWQLLMLPSPPDLSSIIHNRPFNTTTVPTHTTQQFYLPFPSKIVLRVHVLTIFLLQEHRF